jgi:hypothetical protein
MVHPALTRALATTHMEDLHRAAERDRQIRLARHVVPKPRVAAAPIAVMRPRRLDHVDAPPRPTS